MNFKSNRLLCFEARNTGLIFDIKNLFSTLLIKGPDSIDFLQALSTNDFKALKPNEVQYHSFLDRKGHVLYSVGAFLKEGTKNEVYLLTDKDDLEFLHTHLEQFLFAEEVEISSEALNPHLLIGHLAHRQNEILNFANLANSYAIDFGVEPALLFLENPKPEIDKTVELDLLDAEKHQDLFTFFLTESGQLNFATQKDHLFNDLNQFESYLCESKGCYPGQEIVTRISQRGKAPHIPKGLILKKGTKINLSKEYILFDLEKHKCGKIINLEVNPDNGDFYSIALLNQKNQENKNASFYINDNKVEVEIIDLPFRESKFLIESAQKQYELGLNHYHNNDLTNAKIELELALKFNSRFGDAFEALAMVEEKLGNFEKAIALNKKFSQILPNAVMSYTNLSRLYMLKGWIEKAEEEQQKAQDVFFRLQKHDSPKLQISAQAIDEQNKKIAAERERKKKIFYQVLEMDPNDEIAHFGLGKMFCDTQKYNDAIKHLKILLDNNPKYSAAYPLYVKALIETEQFAMAKNKLEIGLEHTKSVGDLMPMKQLEILAKKL